MKLSTDTSMIVADNTEHYLMVQDPHEIMILEHHLPAKLPDHQELMNMEPHTALENISDHTVALVKKPRSRNLVAKSKNTSLAKENI